MGWCQAPAHCQRPCVGQAVLRRTDALSLAALRRSSREGRRSSAGTAFLRPFVRIPHAFLTDVRQIGNASRVFEAPARRRALIAYKFLSAGATGPFTGFRWPVPALGRPGVLPGGVGAADECQRRCVLADQRNSQRNSQALARVLCHAPVKASDVPLRVACLSARGPIAPAARLRMTCSRDA